MLGSLQMTGSILLFLYAIFIKISIESNEPNSALFIFLVPLDTHRSEGASGTTPVRFGVQDLIDDCA